MPDYLFYPMIAAVLAVMAAVALAPGPERQREAMAAMGNPQDGLHLQGEALSNLQAPEGLSMDLVELPDGRTIGRAAAFKRTDQPPLSAGVFVTLTSEFEDAFAGHTVRVSVEARRPQANGSQRMWVSYFGGGGPGDGVWREAALGTELQTYVFEWALPEMGGEPGVDYIGIWPDPEGQGRAVEVFSLRAEVVPEGEDGAVAPPLRAGPS